MVHPMLTPFLGERLKKQAAVQKPVEMMASFASERIRGNEVKKDVNLQAFAVNKMDNMSTGVNSAHMEVKLR
jgi:hypothetical protein